MKGGYCHIYAYIKLVPVHTQWFLYVLLYDALAAGGGQFARLGQHTNATASAAG